MRTVYIYILSGVIFLFACHEKPLNHNAKFVDSDISEITTLVFDTLVYPDSSFRRRMLESYQVNPKSDLPKEYTDELQRKYDSLKNTLDTAIAYILIKDTLPRIHSGYLNSAVKTLDSAYRESAFDIVDEWRREIQIDSVPIETFDFKNLAFNYNYRYVFQSQQKKIKPPALYVGLYITSPVYFNKSRDKAFVMAIFRCSGLCGSKWEFYLQKRNRIWNIAFSRMLQIY